MYDSNMSTDELYHYGVKGMRWGVRRATKKLSKATTSVDRDAAVASLNKHREKSSIKISKLEKKRVRLDDKLRKATTKDRVKASKIEARAAKQDFKAGKKIKKANGLFTSKDRAKDLLLEAEVHKIKANKLHAKASKFNAKYEKAKAKVDANESMQQAFKQGIKNIDTAIEDKGRKYING